MRKLFLLMLLASAAGPALAQSDDNNDGQRGFRGHRAERSQSSNDNQRPERPAARPQNNPEPHVSVDRGNSAPQAQPTSTTIDRVERNSAGDSVRNGRQDSDSSERVARKGGQHPTLPDRPEIERGSGVADSGDSSVRPGRRRGHDGSEPTATIEERNVRTAPNVHEGGGFGRARTGGGTTIVQPTERRVSRRPVFGTEPPAPRTAGSTQAHPTRRWNSDWRHDHRYDWNNWRRHHRSIFHLGWYYDPFGWDYFRYGLGWRMWPSYYGRNFWLNDPWQYRLPPAYGPYRWVRYHYDAVLVNIYTGQIADIVYDFFW